MSPNFSSFVTLFVVCSLLSSGFAEDPEWGRPAPPTTHEVPTTHAPTTHATTHSPTTKAPSTNSPTFPARPTHPGHGGGPRPTSVPFPVFNTPYEEANLNVTRTLYTGLLQAKAILKAGVYPGGVFSNTTSGRITPVGNFDDQIGSFEYFYGLAAAGNLTQVNIIHLIAKGNLVAVRVDLLFNTGSTVVHNLTQDGFITFDSESRIQSYDLVILRLGQASDTPPAENPAIINEICTVHEYYCTGANLQYSSFPACVAEISSMNFGTWDNAASNTTVCRELHSLLVPLRPDFHCPHIGPTGGAACVDVPYAAFYDENY